MVAQAKVDWIVQFIHACMDSLIYCFSELSSSESSFAHFVNIYAEKENHLSCNCHAQCECNMNQTMTLISCTVVPVKVEETKLFHESTIPTSTSMMTGSTQTVTISANFNNFVEPLVATVTTLLCLAVIVSSALVCILSLCMMVKRKQSLTTNHEKNQSR